MPQHLPYQPRPTKAQPLRTEFDQSYEAARGSWLRRRFLWYVGVSIAFSIPWLLPGSRQSSSPDVVNNQFINLSLGLFLFLYLVAFIWAWRARRKYRDTIRLATVLFLIGGIWSIMLAHGFMRPMIEIGVAELLQQEGPEISPSPPPLAFENFDPVEVAEASGQSESPIKIRTLSRAAQDRADRSPSLATNPEGESKPTTRRARQRDDGVRISLGPNIDPSKPLPPQAKKTLTSAVQFTTWLILAGLLFLNHLLVCLFIPWKVRESILPSGIVIGIALVVVVLDRIAQPTPAALFFVAIGLIGLSFIPGTLICWWRFSRFNKSFKLNYESNRFRQMERELEGARTIHESVLPAPMRDGPLRVEYVYEPMRQIGGDMLFVQREPTTNVLHVLILDVTGHGVAAALTVNRVMGEIERSFAEHPDASPAKVIGNLNRYIHLTLSRHAIFVTAIALRIDPNTRNVQYVNAGHPTAFIVRADHSRQKIETTSMLLGAVEGEDFDLESKSIDFKPGDALILYTDGASEATNDDGQMLYIEGVERIITGVAKHNPDRANWPAAILDAIVRHRNKTPQDDTLIATIYHA